MLNQICIAGRITHDLELRQTQSGVSCITFSIACDEDYKPKDGGDRDVDFVRVKAWRGTADFISKYFSKGRSIIVSGRLKADNYTDKDGNKRTDTYILAENCYFGDSKSQGAINGGTSLTESATTTAADFTTITANDGDLPF